MITLMVSMMLLPAIPAPPSSSAQSPSSTTATQTWTGCIQAGSAPATYRLNLDPPAHTTSSTTSSQVRGNQGDPFVQLVSGETKLDLTKYVGRHVRLNGKLLTDAEAKHQAARLPNQQEAAETAAGTGGTPQRHERYVRVQSITPAEGECR